MFPGLDGRLSEGKGAGKGTAHDFGGLVRFTRSQEIQASLAMAVEGPGLSPSFGLVCLLSHAFVLMRRMQTASKRMSLCRISVGPAHRARLSLPAPAVE